MRNKAWGISSWRHGGGQTGAIRPLTTPRGVPRGDIRPLNPCPMSEDMLVGLLRCLLIAFGLVSRPQHQLDLRVGPGNACSRSWSGVPLGQLLLFLWPPPPQRGGIWLVSRSPPGAPAPKTPYRCSYRGAVGVLGISRSCCGPTCGPDRPLKGQLKRSSTAHPP